MRIPCQGSLPEITEDLALLMRETDQYSFLPQERTFFSIEPIERTMRRLEDPVTELLRFFMDPDPQKHDLGTLFLRSFFACLKGCDGLKLDCEVKLWDRRTQNRNRLDIFFLHEKWTLAIENKTISFLNNPLSDYEEHVQGSCRASTRQAYFAILSPGGMKDHEHPKWEAVSYRQFCDALKIELGKNFVNQSISKWQVIAREFIIHLENRFCNSHMNANQKSFVEKNLRNIGDIESLSSCYAEDLMGELSERLKKEVGSEFKFEPKYDNRLSKNVRWFSSKTTVGPIEFELWFQTPAHAVGNSTRQFGVGAGAKLTQLQLQRLETSLRGSPKSPEQEGESYWWIGERRFRERIQAVDALCVLVKELFSICEKEPLTLPPAE